MNGRVQNRETSADDQPSRDGARSRDRETNADAQTGDHKIIRSDSTLGTETTL